MTDTLFKGPKGPVEAATIEGELYCLYYAEKIVGSIPSGKPQFEKLGDVVVVKWFEGTTYTEGSVCAACGCPSTEF